MHVRDNVLLFVPNLIDYVRIITLIISLYYLRTTPTYAASFYLFSTLLDEFDGVAARKLNQTSTFGALMDMVTDRCATLCLMIVLSYFYPNYMMAFQLLIMLDIFSHWFHMYSALMRGQSSHKCTNDSSANAILQFYYKRSVLTTMCIGNELFFTSVYLLYFDSGPVLPIFGFGAWWFILFCSTPIFVLKQLISVVQFCVASQDIISMDTAARLRKKANSD